MAGGNPFLARDGELAALERGLLDARQGHGRLFLLVGEAGIGKTRLADELAARAGADTRVLWGRCWEAGGAPPYWPWLQVLRQLVREADPGTLAADLGAGASAVAALLPEVRARLPGLPPATRDDSDSARFLLFDAIDGFLRAAADRAPLVIILDDLHAADQPTLRLLQFLARSLRGARIFLCGTYRDADARLVPDVAALLATVEREGVRLPLRRLHRDEIAAFMHALSGQVPPDRVVAAVARVTEGTPLFVNEVVRLVLARNDDDDTPLVVPDGIQAAIRGHLARVSDEARALLRVAAVIGREFNLPLVRAVHGDTQISEALAEAVHAGIISELGEDPPRRSFTHILIRETIYRDVGAAERERLHAEVARALEQAGGADDRLAELAHHHRLAGSAGDPDKAVDYAERAGRRALATFAHEEAVGHFERALTALKTRGAADDPRVCHLLLALAEARTRCGDRTGAREAADQAAERARALGAADLFAQAALLYGAELALSIVDPRLVQLLEEARAMLGETPGPWRARVMARLAAALQPAPDPEVPTAMAGAAIAMARGLGDRPTLARVLRDARAAYMPMDPLDERLAIDLESLALAYEIGDRGAALMAQWRLAMGRLEAGEVAAALGHLDQCDSLADQLRQPHQGLRATLTRATIASLQGRFADAERFIAEATVQAAGSQIPNARFDVAIQRLALARAARRDDEGAALEAELFEAAAGHALSTAAFLSALIRTRLGDRESVRAAFETFPLHIGRLGGQAFLSEIACFLGHREAAAMLYERLLPWARYHYLSYCYEGSWQRTLGNLATLLGRKDEARAHFEDALVQNARIGARPWLAQTQVDYADLLRTTGLPADGTRANELLASARTIADELGMPALLVRLAPVTPAKPTPISDAAPGFRREGEYWTVTYRGDTFRLKDTRGLQILAHLLRHPGQEFHVLHLAALGGEGESEAILNEGDTGPPLDASAKTAYKARLEELRDTLAEAESFGDPERARRAQEEIDFVAHELARSVGLGGRDRKAPVHVERARSNLQRRISDALKKIEQACPPLGRQLSRAVRTGTYCAYDPA